MKVLLAILEALLAASAATGRWIAGVVERSRARATSVARAAWRAARRTGAVASREARRLLAAVRYAVRLVVRRWQRMSAPSFFVISFAALIAAGTAGLMWLPGLYTGPGLGLIDATFTATSAVCVTGLIVVDTATHFTFWGQLWILSLFQLGGIGLITLTTAIIGAMGRRLSLRSEMTSVTAVSRDDEMPIWELARRVARFTIMVELVAAVILFLLWLPRFSPPEALWHAVFQSVSAFCNAGFSTFSDSLMQFDEHPATLIVISALIITGGLGFLTIGELSRPRTEAGRRDRRRISSHSYAVVVTTIVLLVLGTIAYALLEWNGVLGGVAPHHRIVNAWFASVTARTAGFNSIDYAAVGNAAGFLTIVLMMIGGSPGSTAGGLKTTTLAVLVAWAWSRYLGRRFIGIHGRAIPEATRENTVSITMLYLVVATMSFFFLSVSLGGSGAAEHASFLPTAFECISAFSTVGLSMGTTGELTGAGKIIVIALMFIGRVGLLAFFSAILLRRRAAARFHPAREDIIVG